MERRPAEDMWHLTIDDLLAAPAETPRLAGPGPFVISLSASTAPVAVPANGFPEYPHLKVYEIKRNEDGRIRYRLRLGPIPTDLEADAILSAVRERYPSAFATSVEQEDQRPLKLAQSPASPPKEQPAQPATGNSTAPLTGQVKCLSELIADDPPPQPGEAQAKAPAKAGNGVASASNGAAARQPAKAGPPAPQSKAGPPAPQANGSAPPKAPDPESGVFAIDFDHFLPPIEEHFKEPSAPKSPKAGSATGTHRKPGARQHAKGHGHGKGHSHGKHPHGKQQHPKHAHPKAHDKMPGASKAHSPAQPAPEHNSKHTPGANAAVSTPAPVASAPAAKPPASAPASNTPVARSPVAAASSAPAAKTPAAKGTAATAPVAPAARSVAATTPPADKQVSAPPAAAPARAVAAPASTSPATSKQAEAQESPSPFAEPALDPNAVTDQVAVLTLPQDSSGEVTVDDAVESMILVALDPNAPPDVETELELHQEPVPAVAQPAAAVPTPAAGPALEAVADIETDVVTLTEVVTGIATITTRALPEAAPAAEVPTLTEVVRARAGDESATDLESIVARNNSMVDQLQARDVVAPVETAGANVTTAPAVAATPPADEADVPELSLADAVPVVARNNDAQPAMPVATAAPVTEVEFDDLPLDDVRGAAGISVVEAAAVELADVDIAAVEIAAEKPAVAAIEVADSEVAAIEADATDVDSVAVAVVAEIEMSGVGNLAGETAAQPQAAAGVHTQMAGQAPAIELEVESAIAPEVTAAPPVSADRTPRRVEAERATPELELELAPEEPPFLKNPAGASTTVKGTRSAPAVIDEPLVVESAVIPDAVPAPATKAGTPASEPFSRPEAFSSTERAAGRKPAASIEPVEPRAATNTRLEEPATARSAATAGDRTVATAAPVATPAEKNAPRVEILADPLPEMDSTQTIRELTQLELADADASRWFAIQLSLTEEAARPEDVPHLDIFDAYRLYSVAGLDKVGFRHALRLGFFTDQSSAEMVAGYLRSFFEGPEVKRVSQAERDRFANRRMVPKRDVGATGQHTIIELATAPTVPQRRLSDIARKQGKEPADSGSLWSRLVAPLKR